MNKKRVILGMSGGIDSSVTALLLKNMGYEVIGVTFKVFHCTDIEKFQDLDSNCCSVDGIDDAIKVAHFLKIRHYVIDVSLKFNDSIIQNFIDEYLSGKTPNPCIICNKEIKWKKLLKIADELESEYISTGHYAKVNFDNKLKRFFISRGIDENKDQSYALWRLTQDQLARTILPLGEYSKNQIRKIVFEENMPIAGKKESFEVCFIPDNNYNNFLIKNVPERIEKIGKGKIFYRGIEIGEHKGYPFYTIGQRRGLGVSLKEPVYVKKIIPEKNIIELGSKDEIMNTGLEAKETNLVKYSEIKEKLKGVAKIRYKDIGTPAEIEIKNDSSFIVRFDHPKNAITTGQSVVFYEGDDIVAGGIISTVID
jgi:tRNA-specific 2-thiouridylase